MTARVPVGPQVRLRPFRVARGLTLEGLVARVAEHGVTVSVAHLSNVECGHQRAGDQLLRAWALALGIDPLDVWQPDRAAPPSDPEEVTGITHAA